MAPRYHVGTSGWHYDHWQGGFYPRELPKSRWLDFYSRQFGTVELNSTFYRLPSEDAVTAWRKSTPSAFTFAVKASRYITHVKHLRGTQESTDTFIAKVELLGDKLGPILFQLPPGMSRNDEALNTFLRGLSPPCKYVLEFRNASWMCEPVYRILRQHSVAFCIHDMPNVVCPAVTTSEFAYIRLHGTTDKYAGEYTDSQLQEWANTMHRIAAPLQSVYVYFNNDVGGHAVDNARTLRRYLGL